MNRPATAQKMLSVGIVISARSDRRLLQMSLQSIERLADPTASVLVVMPRGREHLFDQRELSGLRLPVSVMVSEGSDDSWLTVGLRTLAPAVDVAVFAKEGTIFENGYVQQIKSQYADWEDLVGMIEIVSDVVKVSADSGLSYINAVSRMREAFLQPVLRRLLRARSLMPCILSVRTATCGKLRFVTFSAFCDWMSYALFLDELRPRGRTAVKMARHARELRFSAERRNGFDFGYAIYDRLARINDYAARMGSQQLSYLNPRTEKRKLFSEQALQYFLAPRSRRYTVTVFHGMLAARRHFKVQTRNMQREIRDLA